MVLVTKTACHANFGGNTTGGITYPGWHNNFTYEYDGSTWSGGGARSDAGVQQEVDKLDHYTAGCYYFGWISIPAPNVSTIDGTYEEYDGSFME